MEKCCNCVTYNVLLLTTNGKYKAMLTFLSDNNKNNDNNNEMFP